MKLPVHQLVFDPQLLGGPFEPPTYIAHRAFMAGTWGGPMTAEMDPHWSEMSGGRAPLARPPSLVGIIKSRRTGMTHLIGGGIAPALALNDWPHVPGEEPTFAYYASDRQQASIAFKRARGAFEASPLLAREVVNVTSDRIELRNGNVLKVGTADTASVRGDTLIGAAIDEACWVAGLAELIAALTPALATTGGPLILFSTPRGADGPMYELYKRHFGQDDPDVLVIRAHVRSFNPTISAAYLERQAQLDPFRAPAEWDCQFISGLASWADAPLIDGNIRSEPRELPPTQHTPNGALIHYHAGLDTSSGRGDACAVSVAHPEGERIVVDCVRVWKSPHDPCVVAGEVAALLASYRLHSAVADRYAVGFSRSVYAAVGVALVDAPVTCSESFLHLLPKLASGRVELPPHPQLRQELLALERRVRPGGRDVVGHRPGGHDDAAAAVALAVHSATRSAAARRPLVTGYSTLFDGYHGPVKREYVHPADRDSLWDRLRADLDF